MKVKTRLERAGSAGVNEEVLPRATVASSTESDMKKCWLLVYFNALKPFLVPSLSGYMLVGGYTNWLAFIRMQS